MMTMGEVSGLELWGKKMKNSCFFRSDDADGALEGEIDVTPGGF